jgi:hypothetical protein
MKFLKTLLLISVLLLNVLVVRPAWADAGKFITTPEYTEVTQAIADLTNPEKTTDLSAEAIQQKLADLRFQKYILETAESRSTCTNQTGKTLGIYAKTKKSTAAPTLYYLADGETTDDDVECVGIYLPGTSKITSGTAIQELTDAVAIKVVPGTQLITSANPDTGVVELNVPASGAFKATEINWEIPASTQIEIDAQTPNAPVD